MEYKDAFVGIHLYGYCNGYFGRDSYDDKVIIASGKNWIVAENTKGQPEFADFENPDEMKTLITSWSKGEGC